VALYIRLPRQELFLVGFEGTATTASGRTGRFYIDQTEVRTIEFR
jgi:hypothetical protein